MKITNGYTARHGRAEQGSFSMWDLISILVIVTFLAGWLAFTHSGERGRIVQCSGNLRALGEATQSYAKDHESTLPIGAIIIGTNNTTWDMDLYRYLSPSLPNAKSVYDKKQLMNACAKFFACPSDPIARVNRRSYAMAGRNMHYGWPPASGDDTGLGIVWDKGSVSLLGDNELLKSALGNPDLFPRISQSLLLDPDHTLLLTELIMPDNVMAKPTASVIFAPEDQRKSLVGYYANFHFEKFNYLMTDGHVELLSPRETNGRDGKSRNIWTINAGD